MILTLNILSISIAFIIWLICLLFITSSKLIGGRAKRVVNRKWYYIVLNTLRGFPFPIYHYEILWETRGKLAYNYS